MNVACNDRERILAAENPQEMELLRCHAAECAACHAELELWDGISAAAPLLQKSWQSPELWPRIHQSLAEESQRAPQRATGFWTLLPQARTALTAALLLALSLAATVLLLRPINGNGPVGEKIQQQEERRLLTDRALREAERREAEYIASIDRLEELAQPLLQQAATPLLQNYREKLLVLDSAIAELRAQAEHNQYNAHLRREMRLLYQEKQRTLEDVLREDR